MVVAGVLVHKTFTRNNFIVAAEVGFVYSKIL